MSWTSWKLLVLQGWLALMVLVHQKPFGGMSHAKCFLFFLHLIPMHCEICAAFEKSKEKEADTQMHPIGSLGIWMKRVLPFWIWRDWGSEIVSRVALTANAVGARQGRANPSPPGILIWRRGKKMILLLPSQTTSAIKKAEASYDNQYDYNCQGFAWVWSCLDGCTLRASYIFFSNKKRKPWTIADLSSR